MNTARQSLERTFQESIRGLCESFVAFPWRQKEAYVLWLAQTYYLVRHTTRLICISAGKCTLEDQEYHKKSVWHLKEEWAHDDIALVDLKHLGADIGKLPELPETTATYQANYHDLDRFGPYVILGYSLMLEGTAAEAGGPVCELLTELYGPKACRFLKTHAEDDAEHVAAGMKFLDGLDARTLAAIERNVVASRTNYARMLDAVKAATSKGLVLPKAA